MSLSFGATLLVFGSLLTVVAALSGAMRGTVLSASVLSLALGIILAAVGLLHVDPRSHSIVELIEPAPALPSSPTGCSSSASSCARTAARCSGRWRSRCRSPSS